MIIKMSGACFETTLATSSFLKEEEFPEAQVRRIGRGLQYTWDVTAEQKDALLDHVKVLYESSSGWDMDEPGTIRDRAAMRTFLRQHKVVFWG